MKIRNFEIPVDFIIEFADLLLEKELTNEIVETSDDTITIEIQYDSDDKDAVFDLIEWYDENVTAKEESEE